MTLFSIALSLFLVTNPIGNSPAILSLVADFPFRRQQQILLREALFCCLLLYFFLLIGEAFLGLIGVELYSLSLCGGTLLLIVGLRMIFPLSHPLQGGAQRQEPYLVPIATPLLAGPGVATMIMVYSRMENDLSKMMIAVFMASIGIVAVLLLAPYLLRLFGRRGMIALEQLMGMMLSLIAIQMIVNGTSLFITTIFES